MATYENMNVEKLIVTAIKEAVEKQLSNEFDLKKEELIKQLESRKNEIIASTCLQVMSYVQFEKRMNEFVITVKQLKD